jgi:DmsE family decaheme c-type cytochrome
MGSVTRRDGNAAPALGTATALGLGAAAATAVQRGIAMKRKFLNVVLAASMLCLVAVPLGEAWGTDEDLEYVGLGECLDCHEELEQPFSRNIHARTSYWREKAYACEDCHGPGSAHAESDGDVVLGTPADLVASKSNAVCNSCHDGDAGHEYWRGSAHDVMDVSCVSCHGVHANNDNMLNSPSESETCFECHIDQRAYAFKRSRHPLTDATRKSGQGKMECSDCHNAHGSLAEKLIAANTINDKCYECHREKEAPVLWEHSPVKESCLNCHNPHGSNYPDLLTLQRTRLCQSCHEAGRHQTLAGEVRGFAVMNRQCSNCHAQVHGSNSPAGLKLKR